MKNTNLAETLFNQYRRKVLSLLLLRPDERFYVREIARLTSISVGSLHRELKQLTEVGILERHPAGNQVYYQAHIDCPIFEELASILRKTVGMADVLRETLLPFADKIALAFIFGSVARGEERSGSDVDFFIIGQIPFVEIVEAVSGVQKRLGREVNPVVMSVDEFKNKIKAADHFISRIMEEPKLFVKGIANDLGKLAQDRAIKDS